MKDCPCHFSSANTISSNPMGMVSLPMFHQDQCIYLRVTPSSLTCAVQLQVHSTTKCSVLSMFIWTHAHVTRANLFMFQTKSLKIVDKVISKPIFPFVSCRTSATVHIHVYACFYESLYSPLHLLSYKFREHMHESIDKTFQS